ncbi:MAG: OmpA family protein [Spirochaetales bacterium]|nr:OmpA family protein [Spirochaetales bacterium]
MKQKAFIFILLLCILSQFNGFGDINFCLQGEIQTSPWFYEPMFEMDGISFSTAWMAGIRIARFTAGLDIFGEYMNLNGNKESLLFKGAWLDLGCMLTAMYDVTSWLMLKLSAGFVWNQSSFDFNNSGWLGRGIPGFALLFNSMFYLTGFLSLEIVNRLDLLFSQNELMEDIFYTAGARIHINPGLEPFRFYLEFDASYWNYTSEIMPGGVKSWMFRGQAGLIVNFGKKSTGPVHEDTTTNNDIIIDTQEETEVPIDTITDQNEHAGEENDRERYDDPYLDKLEKSKAGDSILFYTILFNNEELTPESLPILDGMAEILNHNDTLVISIRGYSEFMQNPQRELELCKIRARKIYDYLIARGVNNSHVRQNPIGNIIIEEKKYITIDVIQNDKQSGN